MEPQQVLSTDQRRLRSTHSRATESSTRCSCTFARRPRRILHEQLQTILGSEVRNELGQQPFAALLSPERQGVMDDVRTSLNVQAANIGVEIIDVRIKKTDLPDGAPLQSAFESMRTARYAGSSVDPRPGRQAGADHPRPGGRRRRARPMPQALARTRNSTISTVPCSPT